MPKSPMQAAEIIPKSRITPWFFPFAVLLASLTTTFWLWRTSSSEIQNQAVLQLNEQAEQITGQIAKRLKENETMLLGGKALLGVRGEALTRQEWHQYAVSLQFASNNPGVLGFGFAIWIPAPALQAHISKIRSEGFPEYTVWPTGNRPAFTSIIWIEPFNAMNQRAFGFDMYSDPVRQKAMARACDTGQTSISGKVILVQEGEHAVQNSVLMYIPSYRQGMKIETVQQRQAALRGFVYSPIRMTDLVHAALVDMPDRLEFSIHCEPEATPEHLLFTTQNTSHTAATEHALTAFTTTKTIQAYGATWFLTFAGRPAFVHQFDFAKSSTIFFFGILASLLLTILAWMQTHSRLQALAIAQQALDLATAAKNAEERLRNERNLLHAVMNGTRNAHLVYLDRDFNFVHVNQCYAATCGYLPQEMIGKNHFDLYPDKDNEAIFQWVRESGEPFEVHDKPFEFPNQPGRGTTWWDWTLTPVKNQAAEVNGFVFSLIETTARKKAEQALRASEAQFRLIFEQHSAIMLLLDPATGNILNANAAASAFFGYPRGTLRRLRLQEITTQTQEEIIDILREIERDKKKHFVTAYRLANGAIRNVDVHVSDIAFDDRRLYFAIIHDITDRVQAEAERDRLEAQNRKLQKAESLSRMAGAIAHRINNQLQAVMICLELIQDSLQTTPAEQQATIRTAIVATEKAAEVSNLLLTYLAKIPITFEPLDLVPLCGKMEPLWKATKPSSITLEVNLPAAELVINANAGQLQQLITNLVTNAWEACEGGQGVVRMTCTTATREDIPTTFCYPVDFQPTARRYACIEIADTGCGIDQETFDQLFDPFYSTKFTGRGMGLPVVLGIIRAHKGVIAVESQMEHGSVFRVYLPITEETIRLKVPSSKPESQLLGHGTVLIVEDVLLIREIIATMLESMGFSVLQAVDGVEAVEIFEQHRDNIVCVISDIVMPRMNGWETLEALRYRCPGIPVIFASGYAETQVQAEDHNEMPDIYLEKPFQFIQLKEALADLLSRQAAN